MINKLILIYTITLTVTNIAGWTEVPWLWVGLPFWLFIFGPSLYTYLIYKILKK